MRRARVDLPQPDSPTRARVSPRATSKLTSSTARRRRRGLRSSTRLSHGAETSKSRLTRETLRSCMQPAGRFPRLGRDERRTLDEAALEAPGAARVERAAGRNGVQARHRPLDLREALPFGAQPRNGAHQAHGVGVARGVNYVSYPAQLDDAPGIHHGYAL